MTALLWASRQGHLSVLRELVNVYKADVFQKNKVSLTHAIVTVHYNLSCRTTYVHRQTFCVGMFSIPQIMESIWCILKQSSLNLPKSNT